MLSITTKDKLMKAAMLLTNAASIESIDEESKTLAIGYTQRAYDMLFNIIDELAEDLDDKLSDND